MAKKPYSGHSLIEKIQEWNKSRLDLFEISLPDEVGEFFGVIRFFHQDTNQRFHSKCLRISNRATASHIVNLLIEKFYHNESRVASDHMKFAIYECHSNGKDETKNRRLADSECPLVVQLNWTRGDQEGKFVLKKEISNLDVELRRTVSQQSLSKRRSLSDAEFHVGASTDHTVIAPPVNHTKGMADYAYLPQPLVETSEPSRKGVNIKKHLLPSKKGMLTGAAATQPLPPDSQFTRTLSTREHKERKRKRKEERRANDSNGTVKIYGSILNPRIQYKTLTLSTSDTATKVLKLALEKYSVETTAASKFCLVQVHLETFMDTVNSAVLKRYRLRPTDCPLAIVLLDPPHKGHYVFQIEKATIGSTLPLRPVPVPLGFSPTLGQGTEVVVSEQQHNPTNRGTHKRYSSLPRPSPATKSTPANNGYMDTEESHQERSQPPRPSSSLGVLSDCLPVVIDFSQKQENALLVALIDQALQPTSIQVSNRSSYDGHSPSVLNGSSGFCLVPAYGLYCMLRAVLRQLNAQTHLYTPAERSARLTHVCDLLTKRISQVIERHRDDVSTEVFWLANTSELLHFVKRDEELHSFRALEATQTSLASAVQLAFHNLQQALQRQIEVTLPSLLEENNDSYDEFQLLPRLSQSSLDDGINGSVGLSHLLDVMNHTINLLRHCRVNVALTIQLFSQLFHHMNQWLFNRMIDSTSESNKSSSIYLLSKSVAMKLHHCLSTMKMWAQRQGLELAAECHLSTIDHTCALLLLNKREMDIEELYNRITNFTSLNSVQVQFLLTHERETTVVSSTHSGQSYYNLPNEWIEVIVSGVQEVADKALMEDIGVDGALQLREDEHLYLPLLLPEDGYSADVINELATHAVYTHLTSLLTRGLLRTCVLSTHPEALWNAYLNVYENTGPTNRSIITYEAFGGPGRGSYRRRTPLNEATVRDSVPVPSNNDNEIYAQPLRKAPSTMEVSNVATSETSTAPPPILKPALMSNSSHTKTHAQNQPQSSTKATHVTFMNDIPRVLAEPKKSPPTNTKATTDSRRRLPSAIFIMQLNKLNGSLGLSIVTVLVPGDPGNGSGVYIREVVSGGAADRDGRLAFGDQLLQVDNISLIGADQGEAVRAMKCTGPRVTLRVHRHAAQEKKIDQVILKRHQEKTAATPASPNRQKSTSTNNGITTPSTTTMALERGPVSATKLVWTETDLDANKVRRYRPLSMQQPQTTPSNQLVVNSVRNSGIISALSQPPEDDDSEKEVTDDDDEESSTYTSSDSDSSDDGSTGEHDATNGTSHPEPSVPSVLNRYWDDDLGQPQLDGGLEEFSPSLSRQEGGYSEHDRLVPRLNLDLDSSGDISTLFSERPERLSSLPSHQQSVMPNSRQAELSRTPGCYPRLSAPPPPPLRPGTVTRPRSGNESSPTLVPQ